MKILFISSDNYDASGAFLSMVYLILELRKLGVDSFVILPYDEEGGKVLLDKYKINYEQVHSYNWIMPMEQKLTFYVGLKILYKYIYNYKAICSIEKIVKRENCQIIHINTMCSYVGALVGNKMNIPIVWHIREYMEEDQNLKIWNRKRGYRLIDQSNAIITVSQGIKEKYRKSMKEEKMKVIYNGIVPIFYNPDKTIFDNNLVKVILVGKICESKGQLTAIKAITQYVKLQNKNILIKIVGRGAIDDINKLNALIVKNNIQANVEVLENQTNIMDYYQWADISLMCSKCEAFGRVTIEAMMSGCLVIGGNSGGTSELIRHRNTGLLFETGNANSLYESIIYAVNNKEEARAIAQEGRKIAINKFTAGNNAKEIMKIYNKLYTK